RVSATTARLQMPSWPGEVPAIALRKASLCPPGRDARDKRGHDGQHCGSELSGRRALRQLGAGADGARHARAAEPAIAVWILRQVLLVIILGEIELRRIDDLGGDRTEALLL